MKKIIFLIGIFSILFSETYAVNSKIENIYNNFSKKLIMNYSPSKQEQILYGLRDTIAQFSEGNISQKTQSAIEDLASMNNEELFRRERDKKLNESEQKSKEFIILKQLEAQLEKEEIPKFIEKFVVSDKREYVKQNDEREFIKDGKIWSLNYTRYKRLTRTNTLTFIGREGVVVLWDDGEYRFIEEYENEEKIPYSQLAQKYWGLITQDYKVHEKWENYYGYNFNTTRVYEDEYGVYQSQLDASGFSTDTLIYRDELGKYQFVVDYQKQNIASTDTLFWVMDKLRILDSLREDAKHPNITTEKILQEIESLTKNLTKWKTREEKIQAIYGWILENISYSLNIDLENEAIFSAIETFKNKQGVCTGYTKLSSYMFSFAGIPDAEVIRGQVIDAPDFPQIGHAWLRIGDKYYDPTFDDPVWASTTKSNEEYLYFGLPRDIFYANRFHYGDLPKNIETASMLQREAYIYERLQELLPKYGSDAKNYLILQEPLFYEKYDISYGEVITPELLSEKIGSYEVNEANYRFTQNGQTKQISSLKYYPASQETIPSLLNTINYNLDNTYLFRWIFADGSVEWRLAYDVELR